MPTKKENWQKIGEGPWIVLRFKSGLKDLKDTPLTEIIFRRGKDAILPVLPAWQVVPVEKWNRYNGYRAIAIFFLLAAAQREVPVNRGVPLWIASSPIRPSWFTTFSELAQENKKFKRSDWLQGIFGVPAANPNAPPSNWLKLISEFKGRVGNAVSSDREEEGQRILGDPNSKRAEVFLKTHELLPTKITILLQDTEAQPEDPGETDPETLRSWAARLESFDTSWWKICRHGIIETGGTPSNRTHPYAARAGKAELELKSSSAEGVDETTQLSPLSHSVEVSVSCHDQGHPMARRSNLGILWGLSRRPGTVIVEGGRLDNLLSTFCDAEKILCEASSSAKSAEWVQPRVWLEVEQLPPAESDFDAWLTSLGKGRTLVECQSRLLQARQSRLGIVVRAADTLDDAQRMEAFIASATGFVNALKHFEPLLVIHTGSATVATRVRVGLGEGIGGSLGLPAERLQVQPEFEAPQGERAGESAVWGAPVAPGQALLDFCLMLDPCGTRVTGAAFEILREALQSLNPPELCKERRPALPHAQDVVMDLCRLNQAGAEAARVLLDLAKSHDLLRWTVVPLIKAMARAKASWLRDVALENAVPNSVLVGSWLDGLEAPMRQTIPRWWITRNRVHLESVLAALVRRARNGDAEAGAIVENWLPVVPRNLRETAEAVILGRDRVKGFWRGDMIYISLPFLVECNPTVDVCTVEGSNPLLLRPEFWHLVQRLTLTRKLVQWLLNLPKEYRAVFGLCSSKDWEALRSSNELPRVFRRRGWSKPEIQSICDV